LDAAQDMLESLRELFNNTPNLMSAIKKMIAEDAELKKDVEEFMRERVMMLRDKALANAKIISGIKVIELNVDFSPDTIKSLAFQIRNVANEKLFFVAGGKHDGKPSLTVLLSDDLVQQGLNAVNIIREAAKEIQGGGGGQAFFATAGGKNPDGIQKAIEKALEVVK